MYFNIFLLFSLSVCGFQGVRDLLKAVLDKIQTVPNFVSSAVVQQLLAAREVRLNPQITALLVFPGTD